jgi:hypothetical protein
MSGRTIGVALAVGMVFASPALSARITVTASKTQLLYSQSASPDANELSKVADAQLPLFVVRLTATPPPGVPPDQVRFQWKSPAPDAGLLAADVDLGATGQASVERTLCANVGNESILTAEQLPVYGLPTILWFAPTCDSLPDNTAKAFNGARVRFEAQAFLGNRRLGKGAVSVDYGRLATVALLVSDSPNQPFRDGIGKPGGEKIFIDPAFGVRLDTRGATLPPIDRYVIDSGESDTGSATQCAFDASLAACTPPGEILYSAGGKFVASVRGEVSDGSALCDKLTVNVRTTTISSKLDVTTSPKGPTFAAGSSVNLRVKLHNTSPPGSGGSILLLGNILDCQTDVKVGKSTLSKTTHIDLQHCSATVSQPCDSNADCTTPTCPTCESGEVCLTSDHCSTITGDEVIGCVTDRDCQPPRCGLCSQSDTCVKVLPIKTIFLGVGDSVDLVDSTVQVDNTLPSAAAVTDTWTAHPFNSIDETDVFKYRIGKQR